MEEFGVSINQEDLAATLLSFSINTFKGIEFAAGMSLKHIDQEDYIALWRCIGWLLGIPVNDARLGCDIWVPVDQATTLPQIPFTLGSHLSIHHFAPTATRPIICQDLPSFAQV